MKRTATGTAASMALALALAVGACAGDPKQGGNASMGANVDWGMGQMDRSRCSEDGKKIITGDTNKDNKPDIWKFYAAGKQDGQDVQVLTCKQVDLNYDGKVDLVDHYGNDGAVEMSEWDFDFDGKFDQKNFSQGGKLMRQERDMDFDGRPDYLVYLEGGNVARIERDADGDGRIDEWQFYEDGKLDRIGYDTTGSGKADKWDRAKPEAPPETLAIPEAADEAADEGAAEDSADTTPPAAP